MSTIWVLVIVVAVVIVAAVVLLRSRGDKGALRAPPEVTGEPGAPAERVSAERPRQAVPEAKAASEAEIAVEERPRRDWQEGAAAEAAPSVEVESRPVAAKAPPKRSEADLRERVVARLAESERMLGELKAATEAGAGADLHPSAGSVAIMEEGLQEIRGLADRKQWEQAKDKGEALHAQLSLLLQTARREQSP